MKTFLALCLFWILLATGNAETPDATEYVPIPGAADNVEIPGAKTSPPLTNPVEQQKPNDTVDLVALSKNKAEWPAEVALTEKISWPVIIGGKERGTTELTVGTKVKLVAVQGEQVKVSYTEATKVIPTKATDLVERVLSARNEKIKSAASISGLPVPLQSDIQGLDRKPIDDQTKSAKRKMFLRITVQRNSKTTATVRQNASAVYYRSANTTVHRPEVADKSQANTMLIKIENLGGTDVEGLRVEYAMFAKSVTPDVIRSKGLVMSIIDEGDATDVTILATRYVILETQPVAINRQSIEYKYGAFSEENQTVGEQYAGVGVKVYDSDGELVAKYGADWDTSATIPDASPNKQRRF